MISSWKPAMLGILRGLDMPLQFVVDQALPPEIHTITLSYTLFDVTGKVPVPAQQASTQPTNSAPVAG